MLGPSTALPGFKAPPLLGFNPRIHTRCCEIKKKNQNTEIYKLTKIPITKTKNQTRYLITKLKSVINIHTKYSLHQAQAAEQAIMRDIPSLHIM